MVPGLVVGIVAGVAVYFAIVAALPWFSAHFTLVQ